jgi:hypothetical protein
MGYEPPDKDLWVTQTPVQVLPSRSPRCLLASEVEVFLALPLPECFIGAECGEVLVCRSKIEDIVRLSKREQIIKENFNWDVGEMHR